MGTEVGPSPVCLVSEKREALPGPSALELRGLGGRSECPHRVQGTGQVGYHQALARAFSLIYSCTEPPASASTETRLWYQPHKSCRPCVNVAVVIQCQEPIEQEAMRRLVLALLLWDQL